MRLLMDRILRDGRALDADVLVVDSFLNHMTDPALMHEIGLELARRFSDAGVTKVATIESSGIAPATMTAYALGVPMLIMKKGMSATMDEPLLSTEVFSFTKQKAYALNCKAKYIAPGDNVLFIDDFLANGEAAFGGIRLIEQAGASVAGVGAVIAKAFQPGIKKLTDAGYRVEALAPISRMGEGFIEFEERI